MQRVVLILRVYRSFGLRRFDATYCPRLHGSIGTWFPTSLCKVVSSSRDDSSYFLGRFEDKDTKLSRNVGIRLPTVAASYPREFVCAQIYIQVDPHIRGFGKLKKLTVHTFQNLRQARTGRNVMKSSSPNAPST